MGFDPNSDRDVRDDTNHVKTRRTGRVEENRFGFHERTVRGTSVEGSGGTLVHGFRRRAIVAIAENETDVFRWFGSRGRR